MLSYSHELELCLQLGQLQKYEISKEFQIKLPSNY